MFKKIFAKKQTKRILVNSTPFEVRIAVIEDSELKDFFIARRDLSSIVGNIYKGRVSATIPGINACFVNIGMEKNGFLYWKESADLDSLEKDFEIESKPDHVFSQNIAVAKDNYRKNQDLLVQVVSEFSSHKGPRLTTNVSLAGKFLVLMPYINKRGISKRIGNPVVRKSIKSVLKDVSGPEGYGFIARTDAQYASSGDLYSEAHFLKNLWGKVLRRATDTKSPALLYEEYELIFKIIRDFLTDDVKVMLIDSKDDYVRALNFAKNICPKFSKKLKYYSQTRTKNIFDSYKLQDEINKIFEKRVELKSGGYVVIEETEALISIDVNTGSFTGHKGTKTGLENTAYITNREAAYEIAKQIRFRDLAGIIIIDFIDMQSEEHKKNVLSILREKTRFDKAKITILDFSDIGVVQMVRQRSKKSVQSLNYQNCPYCHGKGRVKSYPTIALELRKKLEMLIKLNKKLKKIAVYLHPEALKYVKKNSNQSLKQLGDENVCSIELFADQALHIEEILLKSV